MNRWVMVAAALVAGCGGGGGGGDRLAAPDNQSYDSPRISPDGKTIAFVLTTRGVSDSEQLAVMALDGSGVRMLAPAATYLAGPAWSPDGATIYFTSKLGIEKVAAAGGTATTVSTGFNTFAAMTPDLSPDGKTLVWQVNGGGMYTLDVSTPGATPVLLMDGQAPRFSHDGKKLLFLHGAKYMLAVMDLASKQVTDLVETDTYLANAAWFPDDLRIAYVAKGGIEVVTVADKSHSQIADQFAAKSMDLSATGQTIVYAVNGQADLFVLTGF